MALKIKMRSFWDNSFDPSLVWTENLNSQRGKKNINQEFWLPKRGTKIKCRTGPNFLLPKIVLQLELHSPGKEAVNSMEVCIPSFLPLSPKVYQPLDKPITLPHKRVYQSSLWRYIKTRDHHALGRWWADRLTETMKFTFQSKFSCKATGWEARPYIGREQSREDENTRLKRIKQEGVLFCFVF